MNTSDKVNVQFRFMLASYVADLLEAEDLLSVKHEWRTHSPCYICFAKNEECSGCTSSETQTVILMLNVWKTIFISVDKTRARESLKKLSLQEITLALYNYLFLDVRSSVTLHCTFKPESIYMLLLGMSKMVKEWLKIMLGTQLELFRLRHIGLKFKIKLIKRVWWPQTCFEIKRQTEKRFPEFSFCVTSLKLTLN